MLPPSSQATTSRCPEGCTSRSARRERMGRMSATTRTTEKSQSTRATLLDVAADTFEQDGYGATSVRDLADRSGLTTGAIYAHFRGKANLLAEAVKVRLNQDLEDYGR